MEVALFLFMENDLTAAIKSALSQKGRTLFARGDAIKADGERKFSGYLVRFTSPSAPDLMGDYFHRKTYYGESSTLPVFYQHGFDGTLKGMQIGKATVTEDEVGLWIEGQLELRKEYLSMLSEQDASKFLGAIDGLLHTKMDDGRPALGLSSGALSHLAFGKMVGNAWQWDQWIIGEASLTPNPAEPKNEATTKHFETLEEITSLPEFKELVKSIEIEPGSKTEIELNINVSNNTGDAGSPGSDSDGEPVKNDGTMNDQDRELLTGLNTKLDTITTSIDDVSGRVKAIEEANAEELGSTAGKDVTSQMGKGGERNAPAIIHSGHFKYDNHSPGEVALMMGILNSAHKLNPSKFALPSQAAYGHLAVRLLGEDGKLDRYIPGRISFMKMAEMNGLNVKSDEVMYSTLSSYGDEWVGVVYSSDLWDEIRTGAQVYNTIRQIEFPAGAESMVIGKKTGSVTFYKVPQADDMSANPGETSKKITVSQLGTGSVTLNLAKIGAAVTVSGELTEDSFLPIVGIIRDDFIDEGMEVVDHCVIDGDTATGATTNINDIAGTPAATDVFLAFNGLRKLALVTNTANSVSVGALTAEDFLAVTALMGTAGKNAADVTKVKFVLDPATNRKALQLPEFKTRDVNSQATVENGRLTNVYGYDTMVTWNMHRASTARLAEATGKIDVDTQGDNTTGSLLAYRPDQWLMGWRRRGTIEAERVPRADATEFTFLMRLGLINRDAEASAIGYNVTV